jgi:hypothetical protein
MIALLLLCYVLSCLFIEWRIQRARRSIRWWVVGRDAKNHF